jgi:hypothetical protein
MLTFFVQGGHAPKSPALQCAAVAAAAAAAAAGIALVGYHKACCCSCLSTACILMYFTVLYCSALYCIVLHCTACRAAAADIELGGYKIPKGTLMFLSMGGMHASPNNFTEPHRFYPVSQIKWTSIQVVRCDMDVTWFNWYPSV